MLNADLDALYLASPFNVPVVFGAQSGRGFLDIAVGDRNADLYSSPSRAGRTVSVLVKAAAFTGLGIEKDVVVDGRQYRIIDTEDESDGKEVRIYLQRI